MKHYRTILTTFLCMLFTFSSCIGDESIVPDESGKPDKEQTDPQKPDPEQPDPESPVKFSQVMTVSENGQVKVVGTVAGFGFSRKDESAGIWYSDGPDSLRKEVEGEMHPKKSTVSGYLPELADGSYKVGVYVKLADGSKYYSAGIYWTVGNQIQPAPVWADRDIRNVLYLQTPVNNPLNLLEYRLEDGTPFFDAVILFSAGINYNEETKSLDLNLNRNFRAMLADQKTFLQPLRDAGIKVYLGLLGDHDASGLCQLSDLGARQFASYVADFCLQYNLDGVNLDDEYSNGPDLSNPLFAKRSIEAGSRLAYELKVALSKKCTWDTEVSIYRWGTYSFDCVAVDGHQPGEYIDFQVADYGRTNKPYGGLQMKNCSCWSVELQLGRAKANVSVDAARSWKSAGYGWMMWFSFCPDPNQVYPDPNRTDNYNLERSFCYLDYVAQGFYGQRLKMPQNYYTLTEGWKGVVAPSPAAFTKEQLDKISR